MNQVDTRNDPIVSDLLLPADVRFTQEAFERDGVGSAVTTIQHILARFHTETRIDVFDLEQAILGRLSLHDNQDKILAVLVTKNFLTPDAESELRMKERPGRSGVEMLEQVILFTCRFNLRTVLDKLKMTLGNTKTELRAFSNETRAHREICLALDPTKELAYLCHALDYIPTVYPELTKELAYFCHALDYIPTVYPELTKKVNDMLKKASTMSMEKIVLKILKEYDHLKLRTPEGQIHAARGDILLKIDTGADATISSEGAANPDTIKSKQQRWGWLDGKHSIATM